MCGRHLYVFFGECLFKSSVHFLIGLFVFLISSFVSCLYILEISSLSFVSFAIIFSHSESYFLPCRDITLLTKVRLVKAMVFLVVMYECESWTVKKAERRRTVAF